MELSARDGGDPPGLASRKAALNILSDVLRKKRPLDAAIADVLSHAKLAPRDAGFARTIAATALRRFGQLEALIRTFVPKAPPPHKAGPTLEILIAGACELLFLNVAPHAAVDAANRLAQAGSPLLGGRSVPRSAVMSQDVTSSRSPLKKAGYDGL